MNAVAITARGIEYYRNVFNLTRREVETLNILDCAAGASTSVSEIHRAGGTATAVDASYVDGSDHVQDRVRRNLANAEGWLSKHAEAIDWNILGSIEQYRHQMRANLDTFLTDWASHPHRYVAGALPELPFAGGTFDLALCSNFLFAYPDSGIQFHEAAVFELLRVAREVRIHPLVSGDGGEVEFVDCIVETTRNAGYQVSRIEVHNSWLISADESLQIRHR